MRKEMRTEEKKRSVEDISGEAVRKELRMMKKRKDQGPDDIPVEAWIALRNKGVEFLVNFFNISKIFSTLTKREDAR